MNTFLDFLNPNKGKFRVPATYYENTVDSPDDGGQSFCFDYVDPASKTYRTLFGNITSDRDNQEVAIRTNADLPFHLASYIVFPNGDCYQIVQCMKDYSHVEKEAFSMWKNPIGIEYVIRMVQIPNPWGIA